MCVVLFLSVMLYKCMGCDGVRESVCVCVCNDDDVCVQLCVYVFVCMLLSLLLLVCGSVIVINQFYCEDVFITFLVKDLTFYNDYVCDHGCNYNHNYV